MTTDADIEAKFWKALKSDRTAMLGLVGVQDGHARPMTAQLDSDDARRGPIYFFTANDTELVQAMDKSHKAMLHFAAKGHDLFASVEGVLTLYNDPATIERLWNPFVAAWYEGGKTDPKLQLLRLDGEAAQIWLNENSLLAGIKMMLGSDPKKDYKDKVAEVRLN